MPDPIHLSKRQIKAADRQSGADLLIPWPPELGDPGHLDDDCERDATASERAWVDTHVDPACQAAGLVAGRVTVARVHGPDPATRSKCWHTRLSIVVIGRRWVGAGGAGYAPIRPPLWHGVQ